MTRMTRPDCAVMCNLINTHTQTHTRVARGLRRRRRRTTLEQQLDAILEQSVRPKGGVWVCLFASPRERENRLVVRRYRDKFKDRGGLFLVASSFNFKYYGRFQMALQARTR